MSSHYICRTGQEIKYLLMYKFTLLNLTWYDYINKLINYKHASVKLTELEIHLNIVFPSF